MATIRASTEERVFTATKWLGLNQAGDGDTNLKMGEASKMINFRVAQDGKLKKRPGMMGLVSWPDWESCNSWHGFVNGNEITVVSGDNSVGILNDELNGFDSTFEIGGAVSQFLGYENKLYMFCDDNVYRVYDGETLSEVAGYIPIVIISAVPAGSGTELEQINKLTAKRRVWFSPDGEATVFTLPEKDLASIDKAVNRVTNEEVDFTANVTTGKVTFATAPNNGTNTLEITYTAKEDARSEVEAMRFAEIYNGTTDNRVFIYGDGTNRALYSGLDYNGKQRADYFPDMNVLDVGDENTPITQMIRHYSRLIVFKSSSAYSVQYGLVSRADGITIPAFYWSPVNRAIGNEAPGTVQLVENNPLTLFQGSIYSWSNNSTYSSNLTVDERQAKRISEKVWRTLEGMDLKDAYCFDDNDRKEWYCIVDDRAIVFAYGVGDVWFCYEDFPVRAMFTVGGELYGIRRKTVDGNVSGEIVHISERYRSDCGDEISAVWESGYLSFNADYRRKYSAMLWIGLVPLHHTELDITLETDRKRDFATKVVEQNTLTFLHANFAKWSFKPRRSATIMKRLKLKAKKFAYYKIILSNTSDKTSAEVTSVDVRVRYTGYVR